MFNNPFPLDRSLTEGVITEVDVKRSSCKVKTLFGKNLVGVKWITSYGGSGRSGDRGSPMIGDNVVINLGLGYPLITGFLPKIQSLDEKEVSSINNSFIPDTGNFSGMRGNAGIDVNKPDDMAIGDKIFQTFGGAILALMRGGSILLRSNKFSEIFLSKYANLVRIVSGNWEHFTDVCSDVIKNYRGRVFRYSGYANTYQKSKSESYDYHEFIGDTALAEHVKTNYHQDPVSPPALNNVIKKEQVRQQDLAETMRRTISLDGTDEIVVTGVVGGVPTFTRMRQSNGTIYITFNDTSVIQVDATAILVSRDGVTKTTHDATGIHIIEKDGSSVDLTSGTITLTDSGGATGVMTGGNITFTDSAGATAKLNAGNITLTNASAVKLELTAAMAKLTDGAGSTITMDGGMITLHSSMGGTVLIAAATAVS